jgi:hypothetical protein
VNTACVDAFYICFQFFSSLFYVPFEFGFLLGKMFEICEKTTKYKTAAAWLCLGFVGKLFDDFLQSSVRTTDFVV